MIIVLMLTIAVCLFLYYYFTRTFNYWRDKGVAGPKPILFFGNIKEYVLRQKHLGIVYKEIYEKFPNERVIGIYRMTNPTLIIRDLDIIKQILIKDFEYFSDRGVKFSKEGLGDNLFHCDSNTWYALRNRLTPQFTSVKLKSSFLVIENHADELIKHLETVTIKKIELDMLHILQKYTMASIIGSMFDLNVNLYKNYQEIIEKAAHLIFKSTYAAEMDMLFPNILDKTNVSLYPALVNKFSYEVIQTANKNILRNKIGVLDILLELKEKGEIVNTKRLESDVEAKFKMTDHLIAGQVFIFFAAGFGNNALSLSYTLFQLAKHQNAQNKLIQEIDDVLSKYDGKLSYDALKEMTYMDKVFSEILRMNTLTNAIQRSATKRYKIPGTEVMIEKGTTVLISPYAIHRDEQLYPDPDHFDPERFSPENIANRHPYAYLPFGAGPRSCLGRQLAKIQFFVAMTKILSRFRVEPSKKTVKVEDYDPMCTLLATKGGIFVNIVPRK